MTSKLDQIIYYNIYAIDICENAIAYINDKVSNSDAIDLYKNTVSNSEQRIASGNKISEQLTKTKNFVVVFFLAGIVFFESIFTTLLLLFDDTVINSSLLTLIFYFTAFVIFTISKVLEILFYEKQLFKILDNSRDSMWYIRSSFVNDRTCIHLTHDRKETN